jgi:hypothetical protein
MPFTTVGTENSGNIDLYYEDHGSGDPRCPYPRISTERRLLGEAGRSASGALAGDSLRHTSCSGSYCEGAGLDGRNLSSR